MRKLLLTLQMELGNASHAHASHARRRHESAAQLLRLLARHAPRLMRTYCYPIFFMLRTRLRATSHAHTSAAFLHALGELLGSTGRLLQPHSSSSAENTGRATRT